MRTAAVGAASVLVRSLRVGRCRVAVAFDAVCLVGAECSAGVYPSPIIKAAAKLASHVRDVEGGAAIAGAEGRPDSGEQFAINGSGKLSAICFEPSLRRCGARKGRHGASGVVGAVGSLWRA